MQIHVLPGDAITEKIKNCDIDGEIIICRECLIDGNVKSNNLSSFWETRAEFIENNYPNFENSYQNNVVKEFENLIGYTEKNNAINLWFEYELFCQVNMWFCLSLLQNTSAEIFRVLPIVKNKVDIWKGFGNLDENDLKLCYQNRIKFTESDILLGKDLWKVYQDQNYSELEKLSQNNSECFPKLKEVCQAEIKKQTRPKEVLQSILSKGETEFNKIFKLFTATESIYGFGDLQVKRILQEIQSSK